MDLVDTEFTKCISLIITACWPQLVFISHMKPKMFWIKVILAAPDGAQGYSDSEIAFTGSRSCACIISRSSIKLHFVTFSCTDKKQRSHAERGRMDPAYEIMEGQATDRSSEVQH